MGFMDKIKGMVGKHPDKANQGIDKASSMADERTGGQYSDQIDTASEKASGWVDSQSEQGQASDQQQPGDGQAQQG